MNKHPIVSQHPVEGRFGGYIFASIRKFRDDLFRRQIPKIFAVCKLQHRLSFFLTETVSRWPARASAFVFTSVLLSPTDYSPGTESEDIRRKFEPGSIIKRLFNELDYDCPFFFAVSSSSSPQIAWAFFFSISKVAASAKAFSLRASSFFNSLISLASFGFRPAFLTEPLS